MEIRWWWLWRENNGNVVVVIYSFAIHEDVLKTVESRVDVGSMLGRCRVDMWSMYLWMEKYIEYMRRGRENNKIVEEGNQD